VDTAFHRQVVIAADNADLTAIIDDLKIRLRRIEIAYFGGAIADEHSLDEHERIIEALAGSDLGRAQCSSGRRLPGDRG
jgi:DNA-binding GntR family transcriptional regulator